LNVFFFFFFFFDFSDPFAERGLDGSPNSKTALLSSSSSSLLSPTPHETPPVPPLRKIPHKSRMSLRPQAKVINIMGSVCADALCPYWALFSLKPTSDIHRRRVNGEYIPALLSLPRYKTSEPTPPLCHPCFPPLTLPFPPTNRRLRLFPLVLKTFLRRMSTNFAPFPSIVFTDGIEATPTRTPSNPTFAAQTNFRSSLDPTYLLTYWNSPTDPD